MKKPVKSTKKKHLESKLATLATVGACALAAAPAPGATFGDDVQFLKQYTDVIVLTDKSAGAQVAVVPSMQGRVMTSTAQGAKGQSFGWINRELLASKKIQQHINVFGGEDRFWMGPEGGQFSIYFAKGVPFNFDNWFTPACIDTEPFQTLSQKKDRAKFGRTCVLTNYSGTTFNVKIDREIRLLGPSDVWKSIKVKKMADVNMVGYESVNRISNAGKEAWKKDTGLLSIWILGMFNPSPATTIVVPIKPGPESKLGKPVNSDYFGPVPPERLIVKDKVIFFSADGKYRSKIGINPMRCVPIMGSYDAQNKVLTVVQFSFKPGTTDYVNSMWKIQDQPYAGDVANSYNDGPVDGGKPLGPFYELESSSPAAALKPGKSLEHVHRTMHLSGSEADLDKIAQAVFGVSLDEIKAAFANK